MSDTVVIVSEPTNVVISLPGTTVVIVEAPTTLDILANIVQTVTGGSSSVFLETEDDLLLNDMVYLLGDGTVGIADPTDDSKPAYGFAKANATHETVVEIGLPIQIIEGLVGLTPGPCFLGPMGAVTQNFAGLGAVQIVGMTVSPTSMLFDPQPSELRS